MNEKGVITVSELIAEGLSDSGLRSEHAMAMAMADASPEMVKVLRECKGFLERMEATDETKGIINMIDEVLSKATIPVIANAS